MMTLDDLFGKPIHQYTDDQAVRDGLLIPFIVRERDTGHRITTNAWHELTAYYRRDALDAISDREAHDFFLRELVLLVPAALLTWNNAGILKSDYTFNTKHDSDGVLWYVPNERNGITIMLPDDY